MFRKLKDELDNKESGPNPEVEAAPCETVNCVETRTELESLKKENSILKIQIEQQIAKLEEHVAFSLQSKESTIHSLEATNRESLQLIESLRNEVKDKQTAIDSLNDTVTSLELKLKEKESEIEGLVTRFSNSQDKMIHDYKKEIDLLETELVEKNASLEEVHQHYQQILEEKETQLKQIHNEFNSNSVNEHSFQVKAMQKSLLQYQEENLRLKELIDIRQKQESTNNLGMCNLPEPTEYEYLRNIIFEYMMGREPLTLAKVIAAVLRFSNEQTEQLIRRQENLVNTNSLMPLR